MARDDDDVQLLEAIVICLTRLIPLLDSVRNERERGGEEEKG